MTVPMVGLWKMWRPSGRPSCVFGAFDSDCRICFGLVKIDTFPLGWEIARRSRTVVIQPSSCGFGFHRWISVFDATVGRSTQLKLTFDFWTIPGGGDFE